MNLWNLTFCPDAGDKHSPEDYIFSLRPAESAKIMYQLKTLRELEQKDWPLSWLEHFNNLFQLTSGNHRVYFDTLDRTIIVCHACRKVGQKAKRKDLDRAQLNLNQYIDQRREQK